MERKCSHLNTKILWILSYLTFIIFYLGKLNTLVITLAGSEKVDNSSLRLQLITKDGSHISDVTLQPRDSVHFSASVMAPAQVFKLKLRGNTRSGSPFQRISRQIIEPSKVLLRVWSASNDYTLPHNGITFLHFQLCNYGVRERFQVTVKERLGYLVTPRMSRRIARTNSCPTLAVRARATRTEDIGKIDSIFVMVKGTKTGTIASSIVQLFVVPAILDWQLIIRSDDAKWVLEHFSTEAALKVILRITLLFLLLL